RAAASGVCRPARRAETAVPRDRRKLRRVFHDAPHRAAPRRSARAGPGGGGGQGGRGARRLSGHGTRAAGASIGHRRAPRASIPGGARPHCRICEQSYIGERISVRASRLCAVIAGLMLVTGCGYNTIQTYDEQVNAAGSQIKVQLQRRADLVPNLVETVKGYAKQEQTIFGEVAEARAKLAGAVQGGNLQEMAQANAAMTAPLGRLLAIADDYPQLKSNENFRALQDQLEGTENRIAVARQDYNDAVNRYNAYIRRFPQVLTAKAIGK